MFNELACYYLVGQDPIFHDLLLYPEMASVEIVPDVPVPGDLILDRERLREAVVGAGLSGRIEGGHFGQELGRQDSALDLMNDILDCHFQSSNFFCNRCRFVCSLSNEVVKKFL